jgi:hypothetical protein
VKEKEGAEKDSSAINPNKGAVLALETALTLWYTTKPDYADFQFYHTEY